MWLFLTVLDKLLQIKSTDSFMSIKERKQGYSNVAPSGDRFQTLRGGITKIACQFMIINWLDSHGEKNRRKPVAFNTTLN